MHKCNIILVLILLVAAIVSCGESKEERIKKAKMAARKAAELQREKAVKELAEKHDALTDWDRGVIRYTIQLQDIWVNSRRPVLFRGYVEDIFRKDDEYYVRFVEEGSLSGDLDSWLQASHEGDTDQLVLLHVMRRSAKPRLHFLLRCDPDTASGIKSVWESRKEDERDLWWPALVPYTMVYAVVAKINNVTRPYLRIAIRPLEEGVELDYEPSDTFIALGDCIGLVYIGDSYESNKEH